MDTETLQGPVPEGVRRKRRFSHAAIFGRGCGHCLSDHTTRSAVFL